MSETKHTRAFRRFPARLLAMSVAGVSLFLAAQALLYTPCWGLFFLVAVVAWPIWHYQQENALFQRRAMLSAVAEEKSTVKRWFWTGSVTRIAQVFVALIWSALLLGLAGLLKPVQWWILAADILLLSLIVAPTYRSISGQIRPDQVGLVARRWLLPIINVVTLTLVSLVIDFYSGVADTRGMAWHSVAETAFADIAERSSCSLAGWLLGALAAIDQLAWHSSEILIPSLANRDLRLAAWGIFLVQAGTMAYGFTRMMLGIISLLEARRVTVSTLTGESTFSKVYILTILLLAVPYIYLSGKLANFDPSSLRQSAEEIVTLTNPCRANKPAIADLKVQLNARLEQARVKAKGDADQQVEASLDKLFADVESGVDAYLDWYFTVLGEYERLAAIFTGDFAALMTSELEQHLFAQTNFANRLEAEIAQTAEAIQDAMLAAAEEVGQQVRLNIEHSPCALSSLDLSAIADVERDRSRATAAGASGVAAGALTAKMLAKKTAATIPAKIASKKGFQAAASLAGKVAAKKGGSILLTAGGAAAVCSPGGPLAALCGIAAGVVTWLLVDKAFVEIDEAVFRDEMRAEILSSVREERANLSNILKRRHSSDIDAMAQGIHSSIYRLFVPARDGV
jgi:hypothetical protein